MRIEIFSRLLSGNQSVGHGHEEWKVNGLCDCVRTRTSVHKRSNVRISRLIDKYEQQISRLWKKIVEITKPTRVKTLRWRGPRTPMKNKYPSGIKAGTDTSILVDGHACHITRQKDRNTPVVYKKNTQGGREFRKKNTFWMGKDKDNP